MRSSRLLPLLLVLSLPACSSSTGPDGGGAFPVASAFPPGTVEVVEEDATHIRLRFDGIDFGGSTGTQLTAADKALLDHFATVYANRPGSTYVVESHTDERGSESANLAKSRSRAFEVDAYLSYRGLLGAGPYISYEGKGEGEPIDTASTAAAWSRNDRIEVVVTYADVPVTRVRLVARELDVVRDCDLDNSDPTAEQPGDFYITASVQVGNESGHFVMDLVDRRLAQANDGERLTLDWVAQAYARAVEGDYIQVEVKFEEYDGNGNYSFQRSTTHRLTNSGALGCWGRSGSAASCGTVEGGILEAKDAEIGGHPCEASLTWSLELETI